MVVMVRPFIGITLYQGHFKPIWTMHKHGRKFVNFIVRAHMHVSKRVGTAWLGEKHTDWTLVYSANSGHIKQSLTHATTGKVLVGWCCASWCRPSQQKALRGPESAPLGPLAAPRPHSTDPWNLNRPRCWETKAKGNCFLPWAFSACLSLLVRKYIEFINKKIGRVWIVILVHFQTCISSLSSLGSGTHVSLLKVDIDLLHTELIVTSQINNSS